LPDFIRCAFTSTLNPTSYTDAEGYLHAHENVRAANAGVGRYLEFYNRRRPRTTRGDKYLTRHTSPSDELGKESPDPSPSGCTDNGTYMNLQASSMPRVFLGARLLYQALATPRLWWSLGIADVRLRYRRSTLGPWWNTVSTGVLVGILGTLWSTIFGVDISIYLPYFAIGHVVWLFISSQLTESVAGFTQFEGVIKSVPLPLAGLILRVLVRQVLVLAHNLVIALIILLVWPSASLGALVPAVAGLVLVIGTCGICSIIIAIFCTRFRDMGPVVTNALTLIYFMSPILWMPSKQTERFFFLTWNPIYHWIELVRAPLLTGAFPTLSWVIALGFAFVSALAACYMLGKFHHRIVYWL